METNQENEFLTQIVPHPMHSTGSNFLSKCSTISTASWEVPVSLCFRVSSSWRECFPMSSVSSQQPTDFTGPLFGADNAQLKYISSELIKATWAYSRKTQNRTQNKAKNPLTLTIHVLPVCHGTVICVVLRVLLKQLSRVVALPSLLVPISPNSTFSRYWAKLISCKMKMKERGLGRNYGS